MKYRIIKIEKQTNTGKADVHFKIQRKIFFFWVDVALTCHYHTITQWYAQPVNGALLARRIFLYDSLGRAKEMLEKVLNPIKFKYKGERIERVFSDHGLSDVFINRSHYRYGDMDFTKHYEHADSLERLKQLIDARKPNVNVTVVA